MIRSLAISYASRAAGLALVAGASFGSVIVLNKIARAPQAAMAADGTSDSTADTRFAQHADAGNNQTTQTLTLSPRQAASADSASLSDTTDTSDAPLTNDASAASNALFESDIALAPLSPQPEASSDLAPYSEVGPSDAANSDANAPDTVPVVAPPPSRSTNEESTSNAGGTVLTQPTTGGSGGGGSSLGGLGGSSGGGGGGGGGGGVPGTPRGLAGPLPTDLPTAQALLYELATLAAIEENPDSKYAPKFTADELLALADHPDALTEAELTALIDDIKSGAWTMAPDGRQDETSRLKNAFDVGGDIVIQAGTWPTQPVKITVDGTRVFFEDGAVLKLIAGGSLDSVLKIEADNCIVIGATADGRGTSLPRHKQEHESILVTGNSNRLINCTAKNSGRLDNENLYRQAGIAVFGNENTIESCKSYDAGYAGFFNRGDNNLYRNCAAYDYGHKGFNQGNFLVRDVKLVTIDGWYSESNKGNGIEKRLNGGTWATGAIAPIGIQLDTNTVQLNKAVLRNIEIGPHPRGVGGVKIACIDVITIDNINVTSNHEDNSASLILAENLGYVTITDGTLTRGVTQFPFTDNDHDEPCVYQLKLTNVTLGNQTPVKRVLHDQVQVKTLEYDNCTFLGMDQAAFLFMTPNDKIASWKIHDCRFVCPLTPSRYNIPVARPETGGAPDFESKTLSESGKLGFVDNTLEAPNGAKLVLTNDAWFKPLMQSANIAGTRFKFDEPPSDPRVTWKTGVTATIGDQVGDWVCIQGGAPGVWVAASWD